MTTFNYVKLCLQQLWFNNNFSNCCETRDLISNWIVFQKKTFLKNKKILIRLRQIVFHLPHFLYFSSIIWLYSSKILDKWKNYLFSYFFEKVFLQKFWQGYQVLVKPDKCFLLPALCFCRLCFASAWIYFVLLILVYRFNFQSMHIENKTKGMKLISWAFHWCQIDREAGFNEYLLSC